jgi:mRNA interferase RelE/StbE
VYEVLIERTAERDLKALPKPVFQRIVPHIRALADTPRPPGCHKLAGSRSDWRIRIGEYRVISRLTTKESLSEFSGFDIVGKFIVRPKPFRCLALCNWPGMIVQAHRENGYPAAGDTQLRGALRGDKPPA